MSLSGRVWIYTGLLVALTLPTLLLISVDITRAQTVPLPAPSAWLGTVLPTLDKLGELGPNDPYTPDNSSNQSCQEREVIVRPKLILPFPQNKLSHTSCMVDTAYGAFSASKYLQRPGSTVAGRVLMANGGSTIMAPIPYSSTGLMMGGGNSYGYNMYFFDNLDTSLNTTTIFNGEVIHKLPAVTPAALKDKAGNMLSATPESMSFSANGDWMVVDVPFAAMTRVNTKTREVLPFGFAINYRIGLGPAYATAISPDGRYAAVASKSFNIFRLYDLSTCGPVPNIITAKVNCSSQDLLPLMQQKIPGYDGVISLRFRSDYAVDMYLNSQTGTTSKTFHYVMTAAGQQVTGFQYLGLGDSFSSGEGAYQYKAITDTNLNKCHLSQRSYPYLIAAALGYGKFESVACSGALIDDISNMSSDYKGQVKDGISRRGRDPAPIFKNFSSGSIAQYEFIKEYQPQIITLSASGNDVGFTDKIKRCLDSDTCYNTYEDRLEIVNEVNAQFYRLADMYTQLKNAGDPHARIYAIGYPNIGDPEGNCANNVHLARQELVFAGQLVGYLNTTVKAAAERAGVMYVDVENALAGHRLCETKSWNVAVSGLTAGNDIVNLPLVHGPVGNESFHPNALGQSLLKQKILEQTSNLTQPMPTANPTAAVPDPIDTLSLLQVPKSNRSVKLIKNITGTEGGVIGFGKTWSITRTGLSPTIKAGSKIKAWINSEPYYLGEFGVNSEGAVTVSATIPSNAVAAGFHTLHLYGKNTSDEEVDMYQTVYVSGDATGNSCIVVPESKQDMDKDGIDDACDPFIDQPPLIVETPRPPETLPVVPTTPPLIPPAEPSPPFVFLPIISPNMPTQPVLVEPPAPQTSVEVTVDPPINSDAVLAVKGQPSPGVPNNNPQETSHDPTSEARILVASQPTAQSLQTTTAHTPTSPSSPVVPVNPASLKPQSAAQTSPQVLAASNQINNPSLKSNISANSKHKQWFIITITLIILCTPYALYKKLLTP